MLGKRGLRPWYVICDTQDRVRRMGSEAMSRVTVKVNGLSLIHQNSGGVSTATLPDVCLTESSSPTPFPNVARSVDLKGGSRSVRADGHSAAVAGSEFSRSVGDEAGQKGGVVSGVQGKEATWLSHSFDVLIEGRGACRHTDKMFHNRGNTINCAGALNPPVPDAEDKKDPFDPLSTIEKPTSKSATNKRVSIKGLDTNRGDLSPKKTLARHRYFVGRYLSFDGDPAHPALTPVEVKRLHKGGLPIVALWEISKYRAVSDIVPPPPDPNSTLTKAQAAAAELALEVSTPESRLQAGITDGLAVKRAMKKVGAPDHRPIYFTVDFDVMPGYWSSPVDPADTDPHAEHHKNLILNYFQGLQAHLPVYRIGVYGTLTTLTWLFKLNRVEWGWQQMFGGHQHDRIHPRAQLTQHNIWANQKGWFFSDTTTAGGLDFDIALRADYGQW
jgi:Domain of unknown function (DUF4150)/Domain of unknown function (DUF1906)